MRGLCPTYMYITVSDPDLSGKSLVRIEPLAAGIFAFLNASRRRDANISGSECTNIPIVRLRSLRSKCPCESDGFASASINSLNSSRANTVASISNRWYRMNIRSGGLRRMASATLSRCSHEMRRGIVNRSISAVRSRDSAASFSKTAALSCALAALSVASATFSSDICRNLSSDLLTFPAKWISPNTPNAISAVANTGPQFSTKEAWAWYADAKTISIPKPARTAQPLNLESCSLNAIPLSNWLSVLLISPHGRRGKAPHPEIGLAIGLLIGGILVLLDFLV